MMRAVFAFGVLAGLIAAEPALAQGFNMAQGGDSEIQVYADNGIEWMSDASRVIAHGNAKAIRGNMTVTADTLTAYYRQGATGNEIWRLDADGNVTIANPTDTATGYKAVYDLDKAILVLHGKPAKLVSPNDTYTADDTLEYWENDKMAVLRGHGTAVQRNPVDLTEKKIEADVLTAHFKDKDKDAASGKPGAKGRTGTGASTAARPAQTQAKPGQADDNGGGMDLEYADAYGHVVLTTPQEVVTGDRGDYNMETGIATVSGSVKITREENVLNGGYAHVDMNTGISKLFGAAPGTEGDQRAQGIFVPEKKDKTGKDGDAKAGAKDGSDQTGAKSGEQSQAVFHAVAPSKPAGATPEQPAGGGESR